MLLPFLLKCKANRSFTTYGIHCACLLLEALLSSGGCEGWGAILHIWNLDWDVKTDYKQWPGSLKIFIPSVLWGLNRKKKWVWDHRWLKLANEHPCTYSSVCGMQQLNIRIFIGKMVISLVLATFKVLAQYQMPVLVGCWITETLVFIQRCSVMV